MQRDVRTLRRACKGGEVPTVKHILSLKSKVDKAIVLSNKDCDDRSPLSLAAAAGHMDVVKLLINHGACWHDVDINGMTAADHAQKEGFEDIYYFLVEVGSQCEIKSRPVTPTRTSRRKRAKVESSPAETPSQNEQFLSRSLKYEDGRLLDTDGKAVMMGWECGLMKAHADVICQRGGSILNIGFGLGIIDGII